MTTLHRFYCVDVYNADGVLLWGFAGPATRRRRAVRTACQRLAAAHPDAQPAYALVCRDADRANETRVQIFNARGTA